MREPKLIETRKVDLSDIETSDRLRPVSDVAVASLVESIETTGLKDEILLRKPRKAGQPYRLIAGGRRCAAFAAMERSAIPAKIYDCTDTAARLMEIDDNLAHGQLSPLDLALLLAERKRVYEKAFPQSRRGAMGVLARKGELTANLAVSSFAASAAEALGKGERTIRRYVSLGLSIKPQEIDFLRNSSRAIKSQDLEALAKIGDPEVRQYACQAVADGTAKTVRDAIRHRNGTKDKVLSNRAMQGEKLRDAWARASKTVRAAFIADHRDEIAAILTDLPESTEVVPFSSARREMP